MASYPETTHALPCSPENIAKSCTFTSLPIRIHRDEHLAAAGSDSIDKDWEDVFGKKPTSFGCRSPYGHLTALSIPEAIPERLAICAYIMDYMLYHDGQILPGCDALAFPVQEPMSARQE